MADVSAVADPNTGVAVYDTTPTGDASGWLVFGGTSASSPIIASVYALAGNTAATRTPRDALFDVTSGSTSSPRATGWDGPTGRYAERHWAF